MSCTELAQQIERLQPNAAPQDVARLCLLLTNSVDELEALREQRALHDAWKRTGLKLQVATDQHAAMTEELEELAASDPQIVHAGPNLDSHPRDQGAEPGAADVRRARAAGCVESRAVCSLDAESAVFITAGDRASPRLKLTVLQQPDVGDREVDHDAGDVDERGHERAGCIARVEAHLAEK